MWSRSVPLLLTALAFTGCAAAAGMVGFAAADDDDDDLVSRAEFAEFMAELDAFDAYDDDNDAVLNQEEYREAVDSALEGPGYFRGFDRDHSGGLTEEEFVNGIFSSYDRDGDNWLDEGQFESAVDGLAVEL